MALEIGQPAPDFTLRNQHGESVSLSQFQGAKRVVVVFYPFAFSSVCTGELSELRDNLADFSNDSTTVLALSCDPMFSLRVFAERDQLGFDLLSDFWPHGEVAKAYAIFSEQLGCAGRATFIVDRTGTLRWQVENEIPRARNIGDYRKALAEIG
ncbi:MAG: peroxiredoxin [Nocardioidaceae bacterium]